ncbi:MAG: hypothetical protein JRJ87_04600 [Deltaproteobacteria bacterium]|nr:hypothetical protein [Deltaproteobacteria bacterium]
MNSTPAKIDLNDSALAGRLLDSLEHLKLAASDDPVEAALAIALAIRIAQLFCYQRLKRIAGQFPATIQTLLRTPKILQNSALTDPQEFIEFLDLIDLMSETDLKCIAPRLHRGWQDKVQSCQSARQLTQAELKYTIDADMRKSLLLALEIYNRTYLLPPPITFESQAVKQALASLLVLIEKLVPEVDREKLLPIIAKLRSSNGTQE